MCLHLMSLFLSWIITIVCQEGNQTAGGNISLADTEAYPDNVENLDPLKNEKIAVEIHRTSLWKNVIKSVKIKQKDKSKIFNPTDKLKKLIGISVNRDIYPTAWLELIGSVLLDQVKEFLDTTFTLKNGRLLKIYFFIVLGHVPIFRYSHQRLLMILCSFENVSKFSLM